MVQVQAEIVGEHVDGGVVFVRLQQPGQDMTALIPKHWVISQQEGELHDQGDQPGSDI